MKRLFTSRVAIFMAMILGFNSLAAAEGIAALPDGPIKSLVEAGKSKYFLTSLLDESGSKLDPADNGKWSDREFNLPEGAREDKDGYFAFLAAVSGNHRKGAAKVKKNGRPTPTLHCPAPPPPPPTPAPQIKEHELFQLTISRVIKVGEASLFEKFSNGSDYYELDADQTVDSIAKFESFHNGFTITGQKVGKTTFTVWLKADKKVREVITVNVVLANQPKTAKAASKSSDTEPWTPVFWLIAILILVIVAILAIQRRRREELRYTMNPNPSAPQPAQGDPSATRQTAQAQPVVPAEDDVDNFQPLL